MDIIIPTYGRALWVNQETARQVIAAGLRPTLVVQEREVKKYFGWQPHGLSIHVLPPEITTIAPTRQHIVDCVGYDNKLLMLDDDLRFYKRRADDPTKFREMDNAELREMFQAIEDALGIYAHVGIAAREGGNRNTDLFCENTRIMRVLGYQRDVLKSLKLRFDEMEVMEDFNVALWLLRKGYANVIVNNYCQNQAGSGKSGGCSHFRTPELQARNAHRLAELHPDYVKAVQKTTKGAWGGGTRTDVNVQWKRAYHESS